TRGARSRTSASRAPCAPCSTLPGPRRHACRAHMAEMLEPAGAARNLWEMNGATRLLLLLVVVSLAAACTPRAGTLRHRHPLLGDAAGEAPLSTPGPGLLFGEGAAPLDTPEAKTARARVAESA